MLGENRKMEDKKKIILERKYNFKDYTIEYCPWCESEQVIFSSGVTGCSC